MFMNLNACLFMSFAFEKFDPLRVPITPGKINKNSYGPSRDLPRESCGPDVLVDLFLERSTEQILVTDKKHSLDMVFIFIVVWILSEQRYRSRHF